MYVELDYFKIKTKYSRGVKTVFPDFKVSGNIKDLMIRGGRFYCGWNPFSEKWTTNIFEITSVIDKIVSDYIKESKERDKERGFEDIKYDQLFVGDYSSSQWETFCKYLKSMPDSFHELDRKVMFENDEVKRDDYSTKKVPYSLLECPIPNYDKLIGTIYEPEERQKLEWAIGSIITGDSRWIQKIIVLYGAPGAGKSTFLNILQKLFEGYWSVFDAKAIASNNNQFAMSYFSKNPLIAIQQDGDLSRMEDNTRLNSIISHEEMTINEKFKSPYTIKLDSFLFIGTNYAVNLNNSKSGMLRRLIDVYPSGNLLSTAEYDQCYSGIDFELGGIAWHCLQVFNTLGKHYYDRYSPKQMLSKTNDIYNFIDYDLEYFLSGEKFPISEIWKRYKEYEIEANVLYKHSRSYLIEELKSYFDDYKETTSINNHSARHVFSGFKKEKFVMSVESRNVNICDVENPNDIPEWLNLVEQKSIFDIVGAEYPAQLTSKRGYPLEAWDKVKTTLADVDTSLLHFVKMPMTEKYAHIVIDFDRKDSDGNKSLELNLKEASKFPATYAEVSKSGCGLHLHYFYDGDASKLSPIFDDNIEIKYFVGNASLRRKLTKCNNEPIATISSGLPMKIEGGDKNVVDFTELSNEKALRTVIKKNLKKEYHGATTPSVSFILKVLDDAYNSGMKYDVTDMRPAIINFALNSTNQANKCLAMVMKMKFSSESNEELIGKHVEDEKKAKEDHTFDNANPDEGLVFFDVEVFSNLFVVVYKPQNKEPKALINPTSGEVEELFKLRLVGFNNRRYDNHILWAKSMGYTNAQLYELSQRIINGSPNAMLSQAYDLSYTDVYDFSSAVNKQSLKKWEIVLGINHHELGLPWNKPVPEDLWDKVAEYCIDDVIATEKVFNHLSGDWAVRKILAKLTGMSVNASTNSLSGRLIFGKNRHPQDEFVYTDLSTIYPGYKYSFGKSTYMDEEPGEGGYVYSEPGMYSNVVLLDIESMHPHSAIKLNIFGDRYTTRFHEIVKARLCCKHKDYDGLKNLLDGVLCEFATDDDSCDMLASAMKTVINSVYGLTSAKFDNLFKDPRNVDNIVAKYGALFMINLKHEVQKRGYTVAHIKTDSIKIPNADDEIINFVKEYGKKYGYNFDHEATYEKMCLVNDAVYIAKYKWSPKAKKIGTWTATGAQFAVPYVFKTLFSKEDIVFEDLCETKSVKTALYLDMNEGYPEDKHQYKFVGKVGCFCPVKEGCGGGLLLREGTKDEEQIFSFATGSKGYRWLESEDVKYYHQGEDMYTIIDKSYYDDLTNKAIQTISQFGSYEWLVSDGLDHLNDDFPLDDDEPPWDVGETVDQLLKN